MRNTSCQNGLDKAYSISYAPAKRDVSYTYTYLYCGQGLLTVKLLKQLFSCCAARSWEQLHCLKDERVRCRRGLGAHEWIGGWTVDLLRLQNTSGMHAK